MSKSKVVPFRRKPADQDRVLLTLDQGVITAKYFCYVGDCGVQVETEQGSAESYTVESDDPTFADYYRIRVADDASYEEKKRAILAATGWESEEEYGWVETDDEGEIIPGTDTDESITAWLRCRLLDAAHEYDRDLYFRYGADSSTQYTPGFILLESLPEDECRRLRLGEADLGGPASTLPCVSTGVRRSPS